MRKQLKDKIILDALTMIITEQTATQRFKDECYNLRKELEQKWKWKMVKCDVCGQGKKFHKWYGDDYRLVLICDVCMDEWAKSYDDFKGEYDNIWFWMEQITINIDYRRKIKNGSW